MREPEAAGKNVFVGLIDLSGSYVVELETGEALPACVFLAVLGASHYCYAQFCLSKDIEGWVSAHINALKFFGGATTYLVPISSTTEGGLCRHPRFREFANHYRIKIKNRPASKTKHKFGLLARYLHKALAGCFFVGVSESDAKLKSICTGLNQRQFKSLPGSPYEWFDQLERQSLHPSPLVESQCAAWSQENVESSHILVNEHYYSVPPYLIGQSVDVRVTEEFVKVFFQGKTITTHKKQDLPGRSSTKPGHDTATELEFNEKWSADRILRWSKKIGPAATYLTQTILDHSRNSNKGIQSCLGLLTLEQDFGRERLEAACRLAASRRSWTVNYIRTLLVQGLEQAPVQLAIPDLPLSFKRRKS